MEPTTQLGLVFALLAMLVLLLGSIVSRRRRERREAQGEETQAPVTDVVEPEPARPVLEAEVATEADVSLPVKPRRRFRRAKNAPLDDAVASEPVEPEAVEPEAVEPEPAQAPVALEPEESLPVEPRKRRFRRTKSAPAETTVVDGYPAEADHGPETSEQAEMRALREQLRALEQVVQQQAGEHPTAALSRVEESAAEQSKTYLRQVSLVVRGLADHTDEDENPHRTLARVAAAVERLGVPNSMERPVLPLPDEPSARPRSDGLRAPSHRAELPELEAGSVMPAMSTTTVEDVFSGLDGAATDAAPHAEPAPVHEPGPVGHTETRVMEQVEAALDAAAPQAAPDAAPGIPAYEEPELVLPVPPPATEALARGRRRRRRKSV